MERRTGERSEFDPVAEHGSHPEKTMHSSGESAGKSGGTPGGKLLDKLEKLGKPSGHSDKHSVGDSDGHRANEGHGHRVGETDSHPVNEIDGHAGGGVNRHPEREAGMHPSPGGDVHAPAQPGPNAGADRHAGHGNVAPREGMAPEQPPADPVNDGHQPGRGAGRQVDAGQELTQRLIDTAHEDPSAQRGGPEHAAQTVNGVPGQHAEADGRHHAAPGRHAEAGTSARRGGAEHVAQAVNGGSGHHGEADGHYRAAPVLADRAGVAEKRLHEAVTGFVDDPRRSVEAADALLEEVATVLADALTERRRVLRDGWHGSSDVTDTEELRASLRDYRDLVDRLLHV